MSEITFERAKPTEDELGLMIYQDYVELLQAFLAFKGEADALSLRAFAKITGVSVSRISVVLRRKGHFSKKAAQKIAAAISESKIFFNYFLSLVIYQTTNDSEQKQKSYQVSRSIRYRHLFQNLESQALRQYDWRHFAIQFLVTKHANATKISDLASTLGLSINEVSEALSWLTDSGHIKITAQGNYVSTKPLLKAESKGTSIPIRQFHRELIKMGLKSLDETHTDQRFLRSAIFTLNNSQYNQLCDMVVNFVTSCTDCTLSAQAPHQSVYGLSVQLFPLCKA